jgi:hypothetical protein
MPIRSTFKLEQLYSDEELNEKILELNTVLKKKIPFLKRIGRKSYDLKKKRAQQYDKRDCKFLANYLNKKILYPNLSKKHFECNSITLGEMRDNTKLKIKFKRNQHANRLSNNDTLFHKIKMYKCKELRYVSDAAFQDFKKNGANFPSNHFVRRCRKKFSQVIKYKSNKKGKKINIVYAVQNQICVIDNNDWRLN